MSTPTRITFRGLEPSEALEATAQERAGWLARHGARLTSCHVTIELPHHHHQQGPRFRVRVDVSVPGQELVAGVGSHADHDDCHLAIRDAFRAARRQLDDLAARRRPA